MGREGVRGWESEGGRWGREGGREVGEGWREGGGGGGREGGRGVGVIKNIIFSCSMFNYSIKMMEIHYF